MIHSRSREEVIKGSSLMLGRGWHILIATLVVTAVLNSLRIISSALSSPLSLISLPGFTIIADSNLEFMLMKVRIGVALVLGAVAFCIGRLKGLAVSWIALAWIMIEYAMWWYRSYVLAKNAEAAEFSRISHLVYLSNATWWDVWIITITMIFLVYQLKMLLRSMFP